MLSLYPTPCAFAPVRCAPVVPLLAVDVGRVGDSAWMVATIQENES